MVVTFALDNRPKITRSSGPKVRSGCDTCKKRHLKCDEAKPSCHRCLKWRGYCEGYSNLNPSRANGEVDNELQLLVEPDSASKVFKHDWERTYFDNWQALAANLGGEWFQFDLFSRTIPQLSHEEPFVRYAAIAVGAMVNAKYHGGGLPAAGTSNLHYNAAINYYGRAIHLVQNRSGALNDNTIRSTLIASILFACFETLDGSYGTAANHINHGLKILESLKKSNQPPDSNIYEDSTLDDEILQVLQRLDYQSWTVGLLDRWRRSPRVYSAAGGPSSSPALDESDIPRRFTSLAQARRWWDLVLYRSLHSDPAPDEGEGRCQGTCFSASRPRMPAPSTDDDNSSHDSEESDHSSSPKVDEPENNKVFDMQPTPSHKITVLESWHKAFLPLYITARTNQKLDPIPYIQSISLLQQYHISWICLRSAYFTDYMTIYNVTPRFREIVRLSEIMLSHGGDSSSSQSGEGKEEKRFTLDNGPTLSLFLTAMKCRDASVRLKALDLLKKYPRRDAFWSSEAAVAIAGASVQLEEANEMAGDSLEEQFARLRMREGLFADRRRELRGRFFFREEGEGGGLGHWVKKPVVIRW
ncbi:hypothetical protein QBC37DRAFT_163865 [Rhypophila decipiens]|uniref:Zn(2)-C6 fungal-type domain-containing protein n=1 Tax=Rhypophila decipiens TaxID=261697 RepID=A0AAN6Y9G5_9PEZI|nr:hypothetical protein QBC37DRAFT_163865 [Rhypophila decipiens]